MTISDEKLVQLFLSGDEAAFSALVGRYKYAIFQFILMKTKNRELAADLTQDVFVRLYNSANKYKNSGKFYSWLVRMAQNICIDHFRKNHGRQFVPLVAESKEADSLLTLQSAGDEMNPSNPAEIFEKKEIRSVLKKAIGQLPEDQREAIVLCHYHGLAYRDIAEIQTCPIGTVKSRVHHALLKIKNYLDQAGFEF
ncbi:MAG: sigma-70 family RNA polymerase sigma factor [Calditrichaeota bacterium]|nr:sigma-70 family RNA polymerase sigma factor [Calditrichota bacterium]